MTTPDHQYGDMLDDRHMVTSTDPFTYYDTLTGQYHTPVTFDDWVQSKSDDASPHP